MVEGLSERFQTRRRFGDRQEQGFWSCIRDLKGRRNSPERQREEGPSVRSCSRRVSEKGKGESPVLLALPVIRSLGLFPSSLTLMLNSSVRYDKTIGLM